MKLFFMGGLPKSGKTFMVNKITHNMEHICAENTGKDDSIEAWKKCFDQLINSLNYGNNIIFDTCNSKFKVLLPLILQARNLGYEIYYIFINRDRNECAKYIDINILDKYKTQFSENLELIKSHVDQFYIINNGDIDKLSGIINV